MECDCLQIPYRRYDSGLKHLMASMLPRKYLEDTFMMQFGRTRRSLPKYLMPTVLDYKDRGLVELGAAGLLIGVECYRIRDGTWPIPYAVITTWVRVELVGIEENYSSSNWVGLLSKYSVRIFHVTLSLEI